MKDDEFAPGWAEARGPLRVPNPKTSEIRKGKRTKRRPDPKPPRKCIDDKFKALAAEKGWTVHRRGWPDFLITTEGETKLVEVKSYGDKLSPKQRDLFTAIEALGIKVYVWWEREPEKLMPWRKFLERSGFLLRFEQQKRAASPTNRNPPRYSAKQVARMIRRDRLVAQELGRGAR